MNTNDMKRKIPKEMPEKNEDTVLGWSINFERNIHMYTHSLLVSKKDQKELAKVLSLWTKQFEVLVRFFIAREDSSIINNSTNKRLR